MPVHWYYNPRDIVKDFGRITDFRAPKAKVCWLEPPTTSALGSSSNSHLLLEDGLACYASPCSVQEVVPTTLLHADEHPPHHRLTIPFPR